MSEVRRGDKYCACCSVCGTLLQKSAITDTEIRCGKCNNDLVVLIENGVVTVFESHRDNAVAREKFKKRSISYGKRIPVQVEKEKVEETIR